jgi:NAD+ kinase
MSDPSFRVALVVKRSAYDLAKENPNDPLFALLKKGDPTVAKVIAAHEEHTLTVAEVKDALTELNADVTRVRSRSPTFEDGAHDLVVTVGGDGTMLSASHGVGATPMLAINSAPSFSVGFFCGNRKEGSIVKTLRAAHRQKLPQATLTRMQVLLNGEVMHQRVLNDALFCHQSPAATSRYILEFENLVEDHKSSGFWIGPAAGSTAAQRSAGGDVLPLSSSSLQCVVRELYTPGGELQQLGKFTVKAGLAVTVRSKSRRMRMYLDGPSRMIKVGLGDVVQFRESPEPLTLFGISSRRKWVKPGTAPRPRSTKPPPPKVGRPTP